MSSRNERRTVRRDGQGRMPFSARLGILITVLVLTVAAAGALMAPGLIVDEVYCEGNVNLKKEDIITAAQLQSGKNIFLTHIGKAKRNVGRLPMVKSVNVQRVFPNRICISVEERAPVAYVPVGSDIVAIDAERIVVKTEKDDNANKIIRDYSPKFKDEVQDTTEDKDEKNSSSSEDKSENSYSDEEHNDNEEYTKSDSGEDGQENQTDTAEQEVGNDLIKIPLISGIEFSHADEGKKIKCNDEGKLDKVISICVALQSSGLLQKSTYIDVTDLANIRLIIENRLDVLLGDADNIDYRAKFMAEVINNKISAYEVAVLDYTGDDIYVRPHDDGKQRVAEQKKSSDTSSDNDEDSPSSGEEKSSDSSKQKNEDDQNTEDEGETTDTQSSNRIGNIDDDDL